MYLPTKNNRQLVNKAFLWRKIHIDLFGMSFRIMTKEWGVNAHDSLL